MPEKNTSFDLKSLCISGALINDQYVSFNVNRPAETYSSFPREIVTFLTSPHAQTVVPGIHPRNENRLYKILKNIQNWKKLKKHSFDLNYRVYSFLWKFHIHPAECKSLIKSVTPLSVRGARTVKKVAERYRSYLQHKLVKGMVFLVPDTKVDFHLPGRFKKPYARPVLVFHINGDQLIIIPFSTRTERMNKQTDILFDRSYVGKALDPRDVPAVENFPYSRFTKKAALIVSAYQPITRDDFLTSALTHIGPVRPELLKFIEDRMKIITD